MLNIVGVWTKQAKGVVRCVFVFTIRNGGIQSGICSLRKVSREKSDKRLVVFIDHNSFIVCIVIEQSCIYFITAVSNFKGPLSLHYLCIQYTA